MIDTDGLRSNLICSASVGGFLGASYARQQRIPRHPRSEMIKTTIGSLAKTLCEPNPLTEAYQAERAARRAALTPEQRQIEDLIREVAELKERLSRASHVMAGEDIYDP